MPYLDGIEKQLGRQACDDFRILVVDNNSDDGTWLRITPWVERFAGRITLVRNPINIGGAGSIECNLDLIGTPWLTFLHQDDVYKSNHLCRLLLGIAECKEDVVAISTQMGSLNHMGERRGTPLRAQQRMFGIEAISAFNLNVRAHAVPWPATAFRTEAYKKNVSPWHSSTFTDSEIVLKMLSMGSVVNINCETMYYRENPMSESHSVSTNEAAAGAAVALIRVISSENFAQFVKKIPSESRANFRREILESIYSRFLGYEHLKLMELLVEESLSYAWEYSDIESLKAISKIYGQLNSIFTPGLMDRLIAFETSTSVEATSVKIGNSSDPEVARELSSSKKFYYKYGWVLPFKVRKRLLKLLDDKRNWGSTS